MKKHNPVPFNMTDDVDKLREQVSILRRAAMEAIDNVNMPTRAKHILDTALDRTE